MSPKNGAAFTAYGWAVCLWAVVIPFQHGFHIAALNQIQAVMTCKESAEPNILSCIPMTDVVFSWVTAMFTVGGLFGSLSGNVALDKLGRRNTNRLCALAIILGSTLNGLGANPGWLMAGRFIIGMGCGLGLVVGPVYMSEIAPSSISGNIGVLTQLSIVVGIMISQIVGLTLAAPSTWRYVFVVPSAICGLQLLVSSLIVESPYYLLRKNRLEEHKAARTRLWGEDIGEPNWPLREAFCSDAAGSESGPLLEEQMPRYVEPSSEEAAEQQEIGTLEAFKVKDLRRPLLLVSLAMASQQLSGMNAVLYYSNEILSKSLPTLGAYVSVAVAVTTVLMTFPPVFLLHKIGRKALLTISSAGAFITTVVLGYSLDSVAPSAATWSSVAIIGFVMSFALGLGPVPFLMISEVGPSHAASALSTVALSVSWVANFVVGVTFLPLRNALANGDRLKEGLVFYVSVAAFALPTVFLLRMYKPTA